MSQRKIYLDNVPLEGARRLLKDRVLARQQGRETEVLPVEGALGRVTALPVFARLSSPHYHASAMDGVAVRAPDTYGATETSPRRLRGPRQYVPVDTGHPLPPGFDAVIMVEDIHQVEEDTIEIYAAVVPWQHVRVMGEDMVATELILPVNYPIEPEDMAALLAGGVWQVEVYRKPVVSIIPTGSELVQPGQDPGRGKVIEFNSRFFSGLVTRWGGVPRAGEIVPDRYDLIKEALLKAARESHIVLVNAGSSAGSRDYTAAVVEEVGELLAHGIAIKPGKPTVLGVVEDTLVVGVPGYPVSAFFVLDLLVKPILAWMQGLPEPRRPRVKASISRRVVSSFQSQEYLRVKVGRVGERLVATPLARGAGVITSLVRADGYVEIPQQKEGLEAGEEVEVELVRGPREIDNTIVSIGSHDLTLDIINSLLRKYHRDMSLSSAHLGSLGGLVALARGEAHLAGIHLLEGETGEYNLPYLQRFLGDREVYLVNLVYRQQGLIVPPGNPRDIRGLGDLAGGKVSYINRQQGAGTRLLLDYHLQKLGLDPREIQGYDREEFSHMAVAAAVASGGADTGLGVLAAARALGLDFIPLGEERYDLAIPAEHFYWDNMQKMLEIIRGQEFKGQVQGMGGYDTRDTGAVLWPGKGEAG